MTAQNDEGLFYLYEYKSLERWIIQTQSKIAEVLFPRRFEIISGVVLSPFDFEPILL